MEELSIPTPSQLKEVQSFLNEKLSPTYDQLNLIRSKKYLMSCLEKGVPVFSYGSFNDTLYYVSKDPCERKTHCVYRWNEGESNQIISPSLLYFTAVNKRHTIILNKLKALSKSIRKEVHQ